MDDVMNTPNEAENSEVLDENSEVIEQGTSEQGTDEREDETNPDETNDDNEPNEDVDNHAERSDEVSADSNEGTEDASTADDVFMSFDDGEVIRMADAQKYAGLGYQFEKHTLPTIHQLEMIMANSTRADGTTYEDISEFVSDMLATVDEQLLDKCRNDAGGNEEIAQELFKNRKDARDKEFQTLMEKRKQSEEQKQQDKTKIVAEQFEELQKSFPEYKQFSDLPKEVKELAIKTGISLFDAKLRYDFQNKKASDKAKEDMQRAANASAGSQNGQGEHVNADIEDMLAAFKD